MLSHAETTQQHHRVHAHIPDVDPPETTLAKLQAAHAQRILELQAIYAGVLFIGGGKRGRPILVSVNGGEEVRYESISEASGATNICYDNLRERLQGNHGKHFEINFTARYAEADILDPNPKDESTKGS